MEVKMENSYFKVVEIEGKGMGCVALTDIEIGTLILKEKPQCVRSGCSLDSVVQSFESMSKTDQAEYLKLHNVHSGHQEFSEIIGIYMTNAYEFGLGIKLARFNHSCCSNAYSIGNKEDGTTEVKVWTKIKEGEEITTNYLGRDSLKTRDTRQNLLSYFGFKCNCELCQNENNNDDDDERYEKFEQLQQEVIKLKQLQFSPCEMMKKMENIKKEISCYKKMYELAQNSNKELSRFMPYYYQIINSVIGRGFNASLGGYYFSKKFLIMDDFSIKSHLNNMKYFKDECEQLCQIGLQMSEIMCGSNSVLTKKWKERNHFEELLVQLQDDKVWFELLTIQD